MRSVKVTFSDNNSLVTSMSASLTDDDIRAYYRIGRVFNVGSVEDKLVKVASVEILA